MSPRKIIYDLLCAEQALRPSRTGFERDPVDGMSVPAWVLAERRAVLTKVNELRATNGWAAVDEATLVKKAEWMASGHSDYTTKYSLYAASLAERPAA
jgi:hypothetical protein